MTSYWLSDYCTLFSSVNIIPFIGDSKNYQYNSLTRLIILVTVLSYLYTKDTAVIIAGAISIVLTVIIYYLTYNQGKDYYKNSYDNVSTYNNVSSLKSNIENDKIAVLEEEDNIINQKNQISLNYIPNNTELKKEVFFLDGSKPAAQIKPEIINTNDYTYNGPKVVNAVTKNFDSISETF